MIIRSKSTSFLVLLSLLALSAVGAWLHFLRRNTEEALSAAPAETPPVAAALPYEPTPIGLPVTGRPIISHVVIADLDADGLMDLIVCDAAANRIGWIRQAPRAVFAESAIGERLPGPVHTVVGDFNQDRRLDLVVACAGRLDRSDDRIGQVVLLENLDEGRFRTRVLADRIARVRDVRATDLNGDNRPDLVVGQHGQEQGEVRWMENLGDGTFRDHVVATKSGAIATAVADYDNDGDVDFAVLDSNNNSQVELFRNERGEFRASAIWETRDPAWGGSGLEACDLNGDGRTDLLMSNGDGARGDFSAPASGHGLQWLENRGETFEVHRIGAIAGCHSPAAVDLDRDGDLDLVAVSAFNHAINPDSVSLVAWLNDGRQNFTALPLARDPIRFIAMAAGDLDGDGVPELVTGGYHAYPPFTRMSRVTLWRQSVSPRP